MTTGNQIDNPSLSLAKPDSGEAAATERCREEAIACNGTGPIRPPALELAQASTGRKADDELIREVLRRGLLKPDAITGPSGAPRDNSRQEGLGTKDKPLRPEDLAKIDPSVAAKFDREYRQLQDKVLSGELKPLFMEVPTRRKAYSDGPRNPKKPDFEKKLAIKPIHGPAAEVWDEDKLKWAISRKADAAPPNVADDAMPYSGPSTISAAGFNKVLKDHNSIHADARQTVKVRDAQGQIKHVSLDMGQLAKLYEVKWLEQGQVSMNAAALLAQSRNEINLGNPKILKNILGAVERTGETLQWGGIKVGKNNFQCEAEDTRWGDVSPHWASKLSSIWDDKSETRQWSTSGSGMCGYFEHLATGYLAKGLKTAGDVISTYVTGYPGRRGSGIYIGSFARDMRRFTDYKPN